MIPEYTITEHLSVRKQTPARAVIPMDFINAAAAAAAVCRKNFNPPRIRTTTTRAF